MCIGPSVPRMPAPPPPPTPIAPPTRDDPRVNEEASALRRRRLAMKGRKSTILTGSMGDTTEANIGKKTLLGS